MATQTPVRPGRLMSVVSTRPERAPLRLPGNRPGPGVDGITVLVLCVVAAVLGAWNLTGASPYMDDEGTYTAQAFSVLRGDLAPYTYQYDHPPLGWIQLGVLAWIPQALGLGDGTYVGATRFAVLPFFVATVVLTYLIARRMRVQPPLAVLAAALVLLSPLSLTLGRQIYLDNIALPWLLLAFYLALNERKALWHHVGAGVFFALAVLSKETMAVFGPALLVALVNRPTWSNRAFSVVGFLVVGGLVLTFYPLMALLNWELLAAPGRVSLQEAVVLQLMERNGSGALWDDGSDRATLLQGWLHYDQHLIVGGVLAGLVCLTRRSSAWLPVAVAVFSLPVLLPDGYLPAMYVVGIVPFLALSVGVALQMVWNRLLRTTPSWRSRAGAAARGTAAAALVGTVGLVLAPHWIAQDRDLLTQEANTDWSSTLAWVQENVPAEDTALVPYALWQDLNAGDHEDPWRTVAIEKADLDPQFRVEHPDGWKDVEWVVLGPATERTVQDLGLDTARRALDNAVPVQSFGDWTVHRVQG
ncbi:ArnT family glycosyltransferase [Kocuria sp. CPCC 205300]|uniref:ArnT family glycosyltransferase n=1 Tax=Kocuria sabuli TaxID=3071448 RepID=UPI0036DA1B8B